MREMLSLSLSVTVTVIVIQTNRPINISISVPYLKSISVSDICWPVVAVMFVKKTTAYIMTKLVLVAVGCW